MPYPSGVSCSNNPGVGSVAIIGPGVTSASGLPPGMLYPSAVFGAGYASGTLTTKGIYNGMVNGLGATWIVHDTGPLWNITPTITSLTQWDSASLFLEADGPTSGAVTFYLTYPDLLPYCDPAEGPFGATMPPGLTLNSDGSITGIPTVAGEYHISVSALDANFRGQIGSNNLTITIEAAEEPAPEIRCCNSGWIVAGGRTV